MLSDLEMLQSSEEDLEWFNKNSQQIREKFAKQIIAIKDKKIIANAKNNKELLKKLEEEKIDDSEVLIEVISSPNEITIL